MKINMVVVVAAIVTVSTISGCGILARQGVHSQKNSEEQAQVTMKSTSTESEAIGYEIIRIVSLNNDTHAKTFYPQISGYKGELLIDNMNQSLKKLLIHMEREKRIKTYVRKKYVCLLVISKTNK
jgi:hypothetical protein